MPQTVNLLDPSYYIGTQSVPGLNLSSLARATDQDVNQGFYGAPIEDYIRSLGFTGPMAYHYDRPATEMEQYKGGSNDRHIVSGSSQELRDWMAKNGYSLNQSIDDKNVRTTMTDANGNVLKDYGYDNTGGLAENLARLGVAAGAAYAGYNALGGLGGGASEGIGTLGAGGTSAGQFVAQPLTGLGASGGLTTAAGSLPTLAELGYGSLGSVGGLGSLGGAASQFTASPLTGLGSGGGLAGGAASIPTLAEAGYGIPELAGAGAAGGASSTKAALYGGEGYGPGMTGAQTSAYDGILGATGSKGLASVAADAAGGFGLGSLGGEIAGLAGNPLVKYGLTGLGAVLGAKEAGKGSDASVASQIDPRMAQYLYGTGYGDPNSLLGAAQALWKQNPSGINSTMQQGLDMAKAALTNPAYAQTYTGMRDIGNGLLNMQVAGNPFTQGRQLPNPGGLLGNGNTGIVPPNIAQGGSFQSSGNMLPPDVGLPTMKALPYRGPGLL